MIYKKELVHCTKCGGTDIRLIPLLYTVALECRRCKVGHLGSEFNEWKDEWKKLPIIPWYRRLLK